MLAIGTKRDSLGIRPISALAVAFTLLLPLGNSAKGAKPMQRKLYRNTVVAASSGRAATDTPWPPANRFEVSSYEVSVAGQGGQAVNQYTAQLLSALRQRNGLVSDVAASNENIIATLNDCVNKNIFCDVVGVTEDYGDDQMTLKLTVWSVPKSHSDLHKARIDGEPHKCNPRHCGRDGCRAQIIQDIVEELAGLDKDHKGDR